MKTKPQWIMHGTDVDRQNPGAFYLITTSLAVYRVFMPAPSNCPRLASVVFHTFITGTGQFIKKSLVTKIRNL